MKKQIVVIYLLIFIAAISTVQTKAAGEGRPIEIKLGRDALGKTPTVEVVVNGKKRLFYFDSGGGISGISPDLAKEIGCQQNAVMTGYNAGGMRFDGKLCEDVAMNLNGFEVKRDVAVFDPNAFFPKSPVKLDGSIALDAFENRIITMDLKGNSIWVENEKSFKRRIKNMTPLVSRLSREGGGATLDFFVAAQTPKGKIWMLVDTGNTNKLLFRKSAEDQLGINFDDGIGEKKIKPVKLNIIGVGEVEADARHRDMIYDGMLSYDIIERMLWTIDLGSGKVWAKFYN